MGIDGLFAGVVESLLEGLEDAEGIAGSEYFDLLAGIFNELLNSVEVDFCELNRRGCTRAGRSGFLFGDISFGDLGLLLF